MKGKKKQIKSEAAIEARSKEKVASGYLNETKMMHFGKKLLPADQRKILITGVSFNNIGTKIANALWQYNKTTCDIVDFNLCDDVHIIEMLHAHQYDTIIICHGYTDLNWIEDQSFEQISEMINSNLTSQIKIASEFVRNTIQHNYKKQIIFIGSMAGKAVLNGSSPYCAAKAGLQHFVKCIAWELAPKGYDVFLINPSNVEDSPMSEKTIKDLMRYRNLSEQEAREYWSAVKPKEKFLTKNEIAEIVSSLVEGKMEYMSGSSFDLVGGQR